MSARKQKLDHRAKKSLGQNFILDPSIAHRIVSYAGDIEDCTIIEIGPGLGILTEHILSKNPKKLIAIEKDHRLMHIHKALEEKYHDRYTCICDDVLNVDLKSMVYGITKIIANLPYNISVIFLLKILPYINVFNNLTLMFQKEVADRIVAKPSTKSYSSLSVLVQLLCDVKAVEDFPPEVFTPSPKIHSSVLDITPLQTPKFNVSYTYLASMLKLLFTHKRKTIRNSLNSFLKNPEDCDNLLRKCGILPSLRAEYLTIEQLCNMSTLLQEYYPMKKPCDPLS